MSYETDFVGNPLPTTTGRDSSGPAKRAATTGNGDGLGSLLTDTLHPSGEYFVRTIIGKSSDRKIAANRILNSQDAAAATTHLYLSAVERLDGIVTDKDGKPLAVIGGFKGAINQAAVYPSVLVGVGV